MDGPEAAAEQPAEYDTEDEAPPQGCTLRDRVLGLAVPTAWTSELPNPAGRQSVAQLASAASFGCMMMNKCPAGLVATLKPYQRKALAWMASREETSGCPLHWSVLQPHL